MENPRKNAPGSQLLIVKKNATRIREKILLFLRRHHVSHIFSPEKKRQLLLGKHVDELFGEQQNSCFAIISNVSRFVANQTHLGELERSSTNNQNPPETLSQIRTTHLTDQNNIHQDISRRLIDSIRHWCQPVFNAKGGHTQYWHVDLIFVLVLLKLPENVQHCLNRENVLLFFSKRCNLNICNFFNNQLLSIVCCRKYKRFCKVSFLLSI